MFLRFPLIFTKAVFQELKTLAKSCGLAESDVHQSLKRMAHSVDAAAKANALSSSVVLAAKKTGVAGLEHQGLPWK